MGLGIVGTDAVRGLAACAASWKRAIERPEQFLWNQMVPARKLICLVDDDPSILRTIQRLLRVLGFEVESFESAEAFLGGARLHDIGCLVLDIHLNGMSGIQLRRQLALSGPSPPVIFITANDSEFIRNAALGAGCIAYLPKPFQPNALLAAIEEALADTSWAKQAGDPPAEGRNQ